MGGSGKGITGMTIRASALQGGIILGTASTVLYLAPASTSGVVKRGVFTNVGAVTITVTATVTRGASPPLTIISAQPVSAGQAYIASELSNLVLGPGDTIAASCSAAASVNAFLSGFVM